MSRIYFVAGEASGDNHGAELLRALRAMSPQLQFLGRGGPRMRAIAGRTFRDWIDQAAVVGLWEVVKHYRFFRREFADTVREVLALQPDAVVLIDYPGFNLRLARALREKSRNLTIIYYISPQVWAWNRRRVRSLARSVDLMLCIFPFEPELYHAAGLRAIFVGHPMLACIPGEDEERRGGSEKGTQWDSSTTGRFARDEDSRDEHLIALFPGSRKREVKKILPIMRESARELLRTHPDLRFAIAAASEPLAKTIRGDLAGDEQRFAIAVGNARELMRRARAGVIASGTATLEAALARLPFVLVYRVALLTYLAARLVVKVKYLGMPNVLANREIVPEFIQQKAQPAAIARAIARLLDDRNARSAMMAELDSVRQKLGEGEGHAAEAIMLELTRGSAPKV